MNVERVIFTAELAAKAIAPAINLAERLLTPAVLRAVEAQNNGPLDLRVRL